MFEYIHSSFPNQKRSPEYQFFSEMKSSLKQVFELFEGVVGFENIHSSVPNQKCSPEYPIFSEMKTSLKWGLLWNEVFSETRGRLRTLWRRGWLWKHSLISPESENVLQSTQSYRKWRLLWNEVFSETRGRLQTLGRRDWLWKYSLISPESKNVLQSTQSYLKWSLLWNSWSSLNSWKAWLALNTFTLHFPIENVLQSTQSYLKWSLLWNEVFSETRGRLRTLRGRGWVWIHSLFISWMKTFSRVPNLLWNEVFSEVKSSLRINLNFFHLWTWTRPRPPWPQSQPQSLLWRCGSGLVPDLRRICVFELFLRLAFDFPDRLEFFSSSNSSNSSKAWLALNYSTGLRLSGSTWIIIFFVFEGVVIVHSTQRWKERLISISIISHGRTFPTILGRILIESYLFILLIKNICC